MPKYWIWSNEHGAWWGPNHRGYVRSLAEAGVYDFSDAVQIVMDANIAQAELSWLERSEVMVHAAEMPKTILRLPAEQDPTLSVP